MGDRMHDVTREAVDIAIRYGELEDSSMVRRLLCRSERVLVASPGYVNVSARRDRRPAPTSLPGLVETRPTQSAMELRHTRGLDRDHRRSSGPVR